MRRGVAGEGGWRGGRGRSRWLVDSSLISALHGHVTYSKRKTEATNGMPTASRLLTPWGTIMILQYPYTYPYIIS